LSTKETSSGEGKKEERWTGICRGNKFLKGPELQKGGGMEITTARVLHIKTKRRGENPNRNNEPIRPQSRESFFGRALLLWVFLNQREGPLRLHHAGIKGGRDDKKVFRKERRTNACDQGICFLVSGLMERDVTSRLPPRAQEGKRNLLELCANATHTLIYVEKSKKTAQERSAMKPRDCKRSYSG